RGDAVAGLLVVFINIIGGIIIGVAQQGMGFADAAKTYTVLTVGDGLVTQVPALIVSTAAGLLVSKAGVTGAADKALMKQLSGYPQALGMSAGVMIVLALLPGIPMSPFLALGGGAAALAWKANRHKRTAVAAEAAAAAAPGLAAAATAAAAEEPISTALKIDDLKIELGYALLPLVNGPDGTDRLTEQIKALRRSLAIEMGFVMPAVRILDNVQLEANTYITDPSPTLKGSADALAFSRNPATMVEHVRARLARQICAQNTSYNGYLPLIALSARWEQAFAESIVGQGEERSLAMQPSKLSE